MRVRVGLTGVTVAVVVGLILAGSPAAASPAGRTYTTSYGAMAWSSSGRATYQPTESGLITGSLSGQVFAGRWSETSSARTCSGPGPGGTDHWGRVVFTFTSNFDSFTGVWGYCDDTPATAWNGRATTPSATPTPRPTPTPPPKCDGKRATISGRSGVINGTRGNDVIVGSSGADTINGRGGRDTICGRGGNDTISGGGKSDVMIGGRGKDTLVGGKGANDRADGGPGADACAAERETSCEREPEIDGPLVEWEVPRRYGERTSGIVYPTDVINPRRYTVEFSLRRGDGSRCKSTDRVIASARWTSFRTPDPKKPCEIVASVTREGTHRVKFTLNTRDGRGVTRERVVLQDWLIVGIGDSNGSGEGTPDKPTGDNARWVNKQCHRSGFSHQALSARQLEKADKQTSVTFVHLSCSGAQIEDGLLESYEGIVPGRRLAPQLDRLKRIARTREVDAVVISAGVNDLHFGEMVTFCVLYERCQHRRWSTFGIRTLDQTMQDNLARLPELYEKLDRRLRRAGISADRVYITEYFNSTTDDDGVRCNPLIGVHGVRDFDQTEATWAAERVLAPLNNHVSAAAARYGWNMISGAEQGFVGHGICAENNWIVTMAESDARQGDANGTLHATVRGNRFQRDSLVPAMRADFYNAAGNPRRPNEDDEH